ncbi:MAG: M14 family metallopeptidase [Candidatus Paceibacterota bacterium]
MIGPFSKKQLAIVVFVALVVSIGVYVFVTISDVEEEQTEIKEVTIKEPFTTKRVIGASVEGRPIDAHTYGDGDTHVLFVGGIHGGYEWNSVVLAYEIMDHLEENQDLIPANITVTIVPSANPDGVYDVLGIEGRFSSVDVPVQIETGTGRFNANGVDLNRNFDCKWQPESTWRGEVVSAGTAPFSEPEAQAIRDLVYEIDPVAVVFWHSQSNAVYASECEEGIFSETRMLMEVYAAAASYPAVDSFDHYEITGDAEGWLASIGIPAITVELATHESIEWQQNLAGVEAILSRYGTRGVSE